MSKVITVQDGNLVFGLSDSEGQVDIDVQDGNINIGRNALFTGAVNIGLSAASFNAVDIKGATIDLGTDGGDIAIGAQSGTGGVTLYNDAESVFVTTTQALGGVFVNNTLTGGGTERVLTASDQSEASAPFSLIGDINTATPPLAEAITALLNFVDLAQDDTIGSLGFTAANDLVLSNLMHDGNLSLITVDVAAGDAGDILFTTGDGNAASDAGGDIILQVGQGSGTGASGNVFINTTTGVGFQGGSVQVTEGAGIVSMYGVGSTGNGATAGDVEIWGGYAANGDDTSTAGEVNIFGGGAGGGPTVGGNVCLMGGESDGEPGSVVLIGGSATTGGTGGTVKLTGGPGAGSANQFGGRVIIDGGLGVGTGNGGQVEITAGESGSGVTGNGGNLILEGADSNATVGFGGDVLMTGGISRGTLAGGAVIITGGASGFSATGVGGPVTITGGASLSTNDDGGTASFISGAGNGTGAGGLLSITGGASGAGATGAGGAISITGGVALSTNDDGGNVTITGGAGNGSGVDGTILLSVGSFERLEAQAGGTVAIRSDGNTDSTDDRLLSFQHQDGTVRATIGHETGGNSVLWIRNLIATGIVRLTAQDTGDVTRTILLGDPDGLTILRGETHVQINVNEFDNAIYAQAGLDVALFYNNTYRLRTAPNGINVRSLSDTDVGQRTISFEHQDGTVRAVIGHEGDDVFVIRNDITGGDLDIVSGDATIAATSGGSVNITSGVGNTTGTGGDITILGGDSGAGASGGGGTITITGGDAVSTNGPGGFLYLQTGESNGAAFAPWITSSIGTVDADRMTAGEVQTTTASTTTILEVTVGSGSGFGFEIHVMGTQDATGDTVFERIFGAVRNQGGTTALVGTNIVSRTDDAGASTWVIDVTGDDTLDELLIEVTGEGSHTIDWKVKIHMLDV